MTFGLRFIIQTVNEPAMNRPVRTRMRGGVGRAGEKPALTRLGNRRTQLVIKQEFIDFLRGNLTISFNYECFEVD